MVVSSQFSDQLAGLENLAKYIIHLPEFTCDNDYSQTPTIDYWL